MSKLLTSLTFLQQVLRNHRGFTSAIIKSGGSTDSNIFHRYSKIMDVPSGVFKGLADRFNGVTVVSTEESAEDFSQRLTSSLDYWIESKRRAIWFKVHLDQSEWIPHLTKNGFTFHHAKDDFVTLLRWLPTHEKVNIPVYSHTMIGVGGAVLNDNNEVLVVSERYSLIPNSWKLPGGYVEPKENLIDAVIREVREETGVEAEFETVLCLRHSHGGSYDCSDMYVVIGLKPKTLELRRCEREIAKIAWMPVDEYLNHENVHETNRHFIKTFLDYRKLGIKVDCEEKRHRALQKLYNIYYAKSTQSNDS